MWQEARVIFWECAERHSQQRRWPHERPHFVVWQCPNIKTRAACNTLEIHRQISLETSWTTIFAS